MTALEVAEGTAYLASGDPAVRATALVERAIAGTQYGARTGDEPLVRAGITMLEEASTLVPCDGWAAAGAIGRRIQSVSANAYTSLYYLTREPAHLDEALAREPA